MTVLLVGELDSGSLNHLADIGEADLGEIENYPVDGYVMAIRDPLGPQSRSLLNGFADVSIGQQARSLDLGGARRIARADGGLRAIEVFQVLFNGATTLFG